MTGARFALALAVLAAVVAAGSFTVARAAFDDGRPDTPPRLGDDAGSDPLVPATSAPDGTTTSTTVAPAAPGSLATPTWVVVVASEGDEATATDTAARLAAAGFSAGVLRSDDHSSLTPGLWVAYVGPFPDRPDAEVVTDDLAGAGFTGTYPRCVGRADQCPAGQGDDGAQSDDGEDDG